MKFINVKEARTTLASLIDEIERGEIVCLTRHGRPVSIMLSAEKLEVDEAALVEKLNRTALKELR